MAKLVRQPKTEAETVEQSAQLGVDSSETIGFTDLSTLGLTAVQFSQGVGGVLTSDGGGTGSVEPPMYAGLCTAVVHDPAFYEPGHVQPNGAWVGELRAELDQAQFDVSGHDDLRAYLCLQIGTNLVGPYTPPGSD